MTTGFRFRAYPDDAVASVLARWIGCQRFIKNAKVREDRYYRAFQRRFADFAGQHAPVDQAYSHLIGDGNAAPGLAGERSEADTTWLREVPSHVLRNGAVRFYQAYQRFFKGLARRPTITSRHGEQSVWLTSELFKFVPSGHDTDGVVTDWRLLIGTKKFPCGELAFVDHKPGWTPPASIHVSVNAGRWHVSFSNEATVSSVAPTEQETLEHLRSFTAEELAAKAIGLDRGVAVPLMAAGAAGGKDFAHQTSRALVDGPNMLFVFEALQVKNMTRSAAGTVAEPGKKVAQKRGLNRSILASAWGETKLFTKYKALAAGKLCIEVPPHHSSQECSACGHTHADNRASQAQFVCQRCGHAENADINAARVIARRGVEAVVSGSYTLWEKKKLGSLRGDRRTSPVGSEILGPERSEATPVETLVSRRAPRRSTLMSTKQEVPGVSQETPTTALRA